VSDKKKINVLVVEDEVLIAQDIKKRLLQLGFQHISVVYNADKALDILHNRKIGFAILDINIGGTRNGIELAEIINEKYKFPFIYLTSYSDPATLSEARVTLPYGYIIKPFDINDLTSSIEMALYKFQAEQNAGMLSKEKLEKSFALKFSEREFELIPLLIDGNTLSKISSLLYLSENTIKTHVKNIYAKLEVNNRAGLAKKILSIE
jgi:DNA-binding NarL/FixJ family response regulator